ncbi:MAG: GNAT family N-acetyltransferase [Alistipes sp.]|nr:GNAT family N-acetyltransferase [Alistipes sp.]
MIRIEGENIILRSVDFSDIDTLLLWENSSAEPLYGVYDEQYTRDDVVQFVENQQQYSLAETEQLRLMICSHDGERLGAIDLTEYDGQKADVSILIFDKGNRNKGFATNALRLAIDYARTIGLHTLYATILPGNLASIALFAKAGFSQSIATLFKLSL